MTSVFLKQMTVSIALLKRYATDQILNEFAELLLQYDTVGIFGQMQSYSVAMNFQLELASLEKHVSSFIKLPDQEKFILSHGPETLVIIISAGGRYFQDFSSCFDYQQAKRPHLVLVTNNQKLKTSIPCDRIFAVPCEDNTASRPAMLQIFTNLVAMHYAKLLQQQKQAFL